MSAVAIPDSSKVPNKARTFSCTPKSALPGSTLTIQMSVPHPWELGVRTPSGEFHFLASCESGMRASSLKEVDCDAFSKTPKLELRLSELVAPYAGSGYKETRPVFREKGRYIFLLAKNLETENQPNSINRCEVNFGGEKN
jgi:hypothetical protein